MRKAKMDWVPLGGVEVDVGGANLCRKESVHAVVAGP